MVCFWAMLSKTKIGDLFRLLRGNRLSVVIFRREAEVVGYPLSCYRLTMYKKR